MTAPLAAAMSLPAPMHLDAGPLGTLEVAGGVDGYMYALSGAGRGAETGLLGTSKSTGAELMNGLIKVEKPDGPVRFTLQAGATTPFTLGTAPTPATAQAFPTGPLYAAYLTLAPVPGFTISAGQIGSVEGYESAIDWENANVLTTDIFYVENGQSLGVTATYNRGPFSATASLGDGFNTGVWNFLQADVSYAPDAANSITIFGATNLGRTGPRAHVYGSATTPYAASHVGAGPLSESPLVNSTMIGGFYSYTSGNLNLVPELQYVYAKPDHRIGLNRGSSNFGAALFADYQFGASPYSIGAWGEYFASNGPDLWFANPGSRGVGVSVTPTWQTRYLFARADLGYLHLTKIGAGPAYGSKGTGRNQVTGVIEAGILF
uniref:outer membrane beta-barrel protein n=1 Tax=Acidocella sp. C78 TaxID=1671486 RepID=UPI0020BDD295|nr:outer membrane beta-barrel protein [Acidocella sp. C78]